jgi:hypothetical protein
MMISIEAHDVYLVKLEFVSMVSGMSISAASGEFGSEILTSRKRKTILYSPSEYPTFLSLWMTCMI